MPTIRALVPALALAFATPALSRTMALQDENGDGLLAYSELLRSYPRLDITGYFAADTNGDGSLDADELKAAQDAGTIPA